MLYLVPMRSMTGYGRAAVDADLSSTSFRLTIEIRSVNHRGFDLKIRSDEPDAYCDVEITQAVRAVVERGTVTVAVRTERPGGGVLDVDRIREMHGALERIRREAGLTVPVDLATVAAFLSDREAPRSLLRGEEMWRALHPAVDLALAQLLETRSREGGALGVDLSRRLDGFQTIVEAIELAVKPIPARFAKRLDDRLAALRDAPGFDPGRAAQEVALMAERLDVSEEMVRLRTHLDHFRELLDTEESVGRKLDFVIQEMGREINTLGSKAQDATVAAAVIDGKAELEKIREQAQNIE
jgi:uncharacterized protein (TIGR00255 family)